MKQQKLMIRNMVCPRCIAAVERLLKKHRIPYRSVQLGEVYLPGKPGKAQLKSFGEDLQNEGFELLDDQRSQLVEHIKSLLIQKVQSGSIKEGFSISKFITGNIYRDYSALSRLFSEVEGITIEQFFILQKIEKVKELLIYDEQSLSQIAFDLGYSSSQHLSAQFKKVTGMTPTAFKKGSGRRMFVDTLR